MDAYKEFLKLHIIREKTKYDADFCKSAEIEFQKIENKMAKLNGREPSKVIVKGFINPNEKGHYDWEKKEITVYYNQDDGKEVMVSTLFHEMEHANQYYSKNITEDERMIHYISHYLYDTKSKEAYNNNISEILANVKGCKELIKICKKHKNKMSHCENKIFQKSLKETKQKLDLITGESIGFNKLSNILRVLGDNGDQKAKNDFDLNVKDMSLYLLKNQNKSYKDAFKKISEVKKELDEVYNEMRRMRTFKEQCDYSSYDETSIDDEINRFESDTTKDDVIHQKELKDDISL